MKYSKICAIFGEGPQELSFGYDEEYYMCAVLKMRLVSAMQTAVTSGCDAFLSTLDEGVSMWGAEACCAMRESGYKTALIALQRSETQASRWHPERRERYFDLIEKSDELINCQALSVDAEEYLLDSAAYLIVLGDIKLLRIAHIVNRAKERGIETVVIPSE